MSDRKLPEVYYTVRAVGYIKPKFNPRQQGFDPPSLTVKASGFWLGTPQGSVFMTCAHVINELLGGSIEQVGMLVVGGNRFQYQRATAMVIDLVHDLAVLDVQGDQPERVLSLCDRELLVGEKVAYSGFPLGDQLLDANHSPTYAEGVLAANDPANASGTKMLRISGPVVGGYSGSPVVLADDQTKLIGVLANGPSETPNIFHAIHWKHVQALATLIKS